MIGKFLQSTAFLFALIMLFSTIFLLPMDMFAGDTDHDNLCVNDVSAQTMTSITFCAPIVYSGAYATIWNSGNMPVRYYFSNENVAYWNGRFRFRSKSEHSKGWINADDGKSFFPNLNLDLGNKKGRYTAESDVSLLLKFDFDGDGRFDETAGVESSAFLEFEYEDEEK